MARPRKNGEFTKKACEIVTIFESNKLDSYLDIYLVEYKKRWYGGYDWFIGATHREHGGTKMPSINDPSFPSRDKALDNMREHLLLSKALRPRRGQRLPGTIKRLMRAHLKNDTSTIEIFQIMI